MVGGGRMHRGAAESAEGLFVRSTKSTKGTNVWLGDVGCVEAEAGVSGTSSRPVSYGDSRSATLLHVVEKGSVGGGW
jgi:hypothetical protein